MDLRTTLKAGVKGLGLVGREALPVNVARVRLQHARHFLHSVELTGLLTVCVFENVSPRPPSPKPRGEYAEHAVNTHRLECVCVWVGGCVRACVPACLPACLPALESIIHSLILDSSGPSVEWTLISAPATRRSVSLGQHQRRSQRSDKLAFVMHP